MSPILMIFTKINFANVLYNNILQDYESFMEHKYNNAHICSAY